MKTLVNRLLALAVVALAGSASVLAQTSVSDTRWGDLGDGTFANPVLNADYSDPDVIRVGDKYYMTCSEFHYMGMPVLESDDMVNWTIIAQIYDHIDLDIFRDMRGYGDGTWAPAIRYHNGRFYIFVCMPSTGLYMTSAEHPEGPWEPLYHVVDVAGWEDPCPLWDDKGNAWLGHSKKGAGPIIIHRMSEDGRQLLDKGRVVYEGPVAEGTKFLMRDGYYYLSIPEGGVGTGWQMVLRSKDIYGPYEGRRVLEQGTTNVNGPHQGALVDTPDGEWWFYHFQETHPLGRVVHLQPVTWGSDGFPVIGTDYDSNGVGEPMKIVRKPDISVKVKPHHPQTDDDFSGSRLGLQWQINHNPQPGCISTTLRKGRLAIKATPANSLYDAHNQVTQKTMGYEGCATVRLFLGDMREGQRAGIACLGRTMAGVGVQLSEKDGKKSPFIYLEQNGVNTTLLPLPSRTKSVWLRLDIDAARNVQQLSYSTDGRHFTPAGPQFPERSASWKGARISLYSYTTATEPLGIAFFDDFTYDTDFLSE